MAASLKTPDVNLFPPICTLTNFLALTLLHYADIFLLFLDAVVALVALCNPVYYIIITINLFGCEAVSLLSI